MEVLTVDGVPWTPEAKKAASRRQAAALRQLCTPSRPWKEWLVVTRADGTPWGEPAPAGLDRWIQKIAVELAVAAGVSAEESALFVEVNRPLIEDRFREGIARSAVVTELHDLSIAAGMILAA